MKRVFFKLFTIHFSLFTLAGCSSPKTLDLLQYVDQRIGTGGHGHVFMGTSVPFGAVQLGPTSIPESWDWCSGYHSSDSTVIGFSHTHLNGTGIGDLFDVTVMPVTGPVTYARGTEDDPNSGLWSYFSRENETARPEYYATKLSRYDIDVELTATKRVGMHRYTFPASSEAAIVFDLENGGCWDEATGTHITQTGPTTITGWRHSTGWAKDQRVFFAAEFSKPFTAMSLTEGERYGRFDFTTTEGEQIMLKVAISPVSVANARENLDAELANWAFDAVVANARREWNEALSKITIETTDEAARRVFYTALYHTMIAPSTFCDVNGDYRGADGKTYNAGAKKVYTTFSLWDTYRAAQPLATIIHPEMTRDVISTMLEIFRQQGKLPVWHLAGNETDCMVGNPGIPVVADAVLKGFEGFDVELAYEALKESAMRPERGMDLRMAHGYIPSDKMAESVAYDLEYALADWAVAQVATKRGKTADAEYFTERAKSYRNYFDPSTGFMRGRLANGSWRTPFDPVASTHREDDFCEGNAWQYTWLVPHDVPGLVECFGGTEPFAAKFDSLFTADSTLREGASPDISGLIGQYAHGNEPGHHIPYLYTVVGQPWKTADLVRRILAEMYRDAEDGLSGNEDVGQMSAWYVLSSLGFYQVEPAGGRYFFGSPLFDRAVLKVAGGEFTVRTVGNSPENRYIQSITLNGAPHAKAWIDYADIAAGGELVFTMGSTPAKWY